MPRSYLAYAMLISTFYYYALDDADTLSVKSDLEVAEQQQPVTVVAEDSAMPGCT